MQKNSKTEKRARVRLNNRASMGLLGLFLIAGGGASQAAPGGLAGLGNTTCSEFSQYIKQDPNKETDYFNWLEGYISGSNIMLQIEKKPQHDASSFNPGQHRQFVRGWCNLHPSDQFVIAAYQLFIALSVIPQQ